MSVKLLIVVFLRGGADGLQLIGPAGDEDYIAARPEPLRVTRKGDQAGLLLSEQAADVDFRFHAQATGLHQLFEAGELGVVHASGLTDGTRSHFDAEAKMERAAIGSAAGGWLGRWIESEISDGIMPILATGSGAPDSLSGARDVAVAEALEDLMIAQGHDLAPALRRRLADGFGAHPLIGAPIQKLIELSASLERHIVDQNTGDVADYVPAVDYPGGGLARTFKTVARAAKLDLGLRVATLDFGGWDTHIDQDNDFPRLVNALSTALTAFWRDIEAHQDRTTIVIMSEFGRRLRANTGGGTDHGFGNAMMVMGAGVRGGRMYGDWPGLANDALDAGADLDITTDYRHVLAEVLGAQMGSNAISSIFPDFSAKPLGLIG